MRGVRKAVDRRLERVQRRLHERPFPHPHLTRFAAKVTFGFRPSARRIFSYASAGARASKWIAMQSPDAVSIPAWRMIASGVL